MTSCRCVQLQPTERFVNYQSLRKISLAPQIESGAGSEHSNAGAESKGVKL